MEVVIKNYSFFGSQLMSYATSCNTVWLLFAMLTMNLLQLLNYCQKLAHALTDDIAGIVFVNESLPLSKEMICCLALGSSYVTCKTAEQH